MPSENLKTITKNNFVRQQTSTNTKLRISIGRLLTYHIGTNNKQKT